MIRAKVLGRKHSKRFSKPDFCLVKTELRSNDLRIQVFVLEKPYIVYMCIVEIDEIDITSINKTITESIANKDLDFFVCWLWKEPFSMAPQTAV